MAVLPRPSGAGCPGDLGDLVPQIFAQAFDEVQVGLARQHGAECFGGEGRRGLRVAADRGQCGFSLSQTYVGQQAQDQFRPVQTSPQVVVLPEFGGEKRCEMLDRDPFELGGRLFAPRARSLPPFPSTGGVSAVALIGLNCATGISLN